MKRKNEYISEYTEGVKVELKAYMLVYKGNICEHWRYVVLMVQIVIRFFYIIIIKKQKVLKRIYLTEENI